MERKREPVVEALVNQTAAAIRAADLDESVAEMLLALVENDPPRPKLFQEPSDGATAQSRGRQLW